MNSKAVITGDLTQIDLPNPKRSGLLEALSVLNGVEGVRFCHFEDGDVVRHTLVQRIVRAYDTHQREQQMTLGLNEVPLGAAPLDAAVASNQSHVPVRKTQ